MLLGCIGDDFTGSSDLANNLSKGHMRVVQYCGIPTENAASKVEAGVIALKTRSVAPNEAVAKSLAAVDWLLMQGCEQIYFKYCSTFDSTRAGNIGPVTDALAARLEESHVIVCPSFPEAGRTVYQGHLFVNDKLLNESGMENHPLTPMVDADIRRWLALQSKTNIGHIPYQIVNKGAAAIRERIEIIDAPSLIVVDAIGDDDLSSIAQAVAGRKLISGGSGVAIGLPDMYRSNGQIGQNRQDWSGEKGPAAILSGSCSSATQAQVKRYAKNHPSFDIRADALMAGEIDASTVANWLLDRKEANPLAYSSADPAAIVAAQSRYDGDVLASAVETFFADVAKLIVCGGISRLITAGGETSGAVVAGLGLSELEIGPEIAAGVPALRAAGERPLVLALKSGNFGTTDFFEHALHILEGP